MKSSIPKLVSKGTVIILLWNRRSRMSKLLPKGAASEGDAHAAFNFSATLECPGSKQIFFHKK